MKAATIIILLIIIAKIQFNKAIIGYDCGTKTLNVTTVSLLEVGECDIPMRELKTGEKKIQLLQIIEFHEVPVIQCKLEISRTVYKCAWFGHLLPTENAVKEYIYDIGRDACQKLHDTGVYNYADRHLISGIKINDTQSYSIDFAGNAKDNECNGGSFGDFYGTWNDVLVQGSIKITLTQFRAQANLNSDKVHLKSGTSCRLSDTHCVDS